MAKKNKIKKTSLKIDPYFILPIHDGQYALGGNPLPENGMYSPEQLTELQKLLEQGNTTPTETEPGFFGSQEAGSLYGASGNIAGGATDTFGGGYDPADPAAREGLKGRSALSAGLKGAGTGAQLGSAFGAPGTAIGAGVGAVAGAVGGFVKADKAIDAYAQSKQGLYRAYGGPIEYPLGGELDSIEGPSHANGGVAIRQDVEAEGGEAMMGNEILSDRLVNPTTGNTFAEDAKKIEKKYIRDDAFSQAAKHAEMQKLVALNDAERQKAEALDQTIATDAMAFGGYFSKDDKGKVTVAPEAKRLMQEAAKMRGMDIMSYGEKIMAYGGTKDKYPNGGTVSSTPSPNPYLAAHQDFYKRNSPDLNTQQARSNSGFDRKLTQAELDTWWDDRLKNSPSLLESEYKPKEVWIKSGDTLGKEVPHYAFYNKPSAVMASTPMPTPIPTPTKEPRILSSTGQDLGPGQEGYQVDIQLGQGLDDINYKNREARAATAAYNEDRKGINTGLSQSLTPEDLEYIKANHISPSQYFDKFPEKRVTPSQPRTFAAGGPIVPPFEEPMYDETPTSGHLFLGPPDLGYNINNLGVSPVGSEDMLPAPSLDYNVNSMGVGPVDYQDMAPNFDLNIGLPDMEDLLDAGLKNPDKQVGKRKFGAEEAALLASSAAGIDNLIKSFGSEYQTYDRFTPEDLDLSEARKQIERDTAKNRSALRGTVRGNAKTSGEALSALTVGNTALSESQMDADLATFLQEVEYNTAMQNQAGQFNTQIANQEREANAQNRAMAQSVGNLALSDLGASIQGYMKDKKLTKTEFEKNKTLLNVINSMSPDYKWEDDNGEFAIRFVNTLNGKTK